MAAALIVCGVRRERLATLRLLFWLLPLLAGCATQRPATPDHAESAAARQAHLLGLAHWEARGRVAIKSADTGGQGSLQWQQTGSVARIRLSGPFGAGAYEINWMPGQITVLSRGAEAALEYVGPDAAERFLAEQVGWSFPVTSIRYWLLGLADPGAPAATQSDAWGRLLELQQAGWVVRYEDYAQSAATWLPRKLVIEREQLRLRFVIDKWLL
ncbi:MAG: lipoprotein insertase outer membrane protein LolB [Gammaproteobacteria bacterium]|nr:lipoprotein insertase outer membrane protein LolB [Gammaproteobacteria bacterium]